MKFREKQLSSRGEHAPRLTQRLSLQVVWQFMQQKEYDVGIESSFRLRHGRGIVFDEIHFPRKIDKLALRVNKLVVNDVRDEDALGACLNSCVHDSRNYVSKRT